MNFIDNLDHNHKQFFNSDFLDSIKKNCLESFEFVINKENINLDPNQKEALINILKFRLDGGLPNFYQDDDNNSYFNWEKNLNSELCEYLNDFDKYYFTTGISESFDQDFNNNVLLPVLNNIQTSYDKLTSINIDNYNNPKKIIVDIYQFVDEFYNGKKKLQYIFVILGLKKFIELVGQTYPNILDSLKFMEKISSQVDFSELIRFVVSDIKKFIQSKFVQSKLVRTNINMIGGEYKDDLEDKNKYFNILAGIEKNINCLFWIVYSDKIKFVDTLLKKYSIPNEYFEELEKKQKEKFDSDDIANLFDSFDKIENNFMDIVEPKVLTHEDFATIDEIRHLIDMEIENFLEGFSDPDDIVIIKKSLDTCKARLELSVNLKKTADMITKFIK